MERRELETMSQFYKINYTTYKSTIFINDKVMIHLTSSIWNMHKESTAHFH